MARNVYQIQPPTDASDESLQIMVTDLNRILNEIAVDISRLEGRDGQTPEFNNDLDLRGRRICNVGRTRDNRDVPSVEELIENAMYRVTGRHRTRFPIEAVQGVIVPETTESDQVLPKKQIERGFSSSGHVHDNLYPRLATDETITGDYTFDGQILWGADTPAQITADQDDYVIADMIVIRLSSDAPRTITGIAGGVDGRVVLLFNVGSNNIVLSDQDANSAASNRIITGTGANRTVQADEHAALWYDSTDSRWRIWAN